MITFTCPACGHIEKVSPDGPSVPAHSVPSAVPVAPPASSATCPVHGFAWKTNSRGYYCSGKTNGKWCTEKPA